jgi:hypothetical protein
LLAAVWMQSAAVHVGRVTAVYWGDQVALATALAEFADAQVAWPGLDVPERRVRVILARDDAQFDSIVGGRVPEWGAAVAMPATNSIVVRASDGLVTLQQRLRHELAHLALREAVPRGVPRWFDEGYAVVAAQEWDAGNVLRVNWAVLRGVRPTLGDVDRALQRPSPSGAIGAYAYAATAVRLVQRLGGDAGLRPILEGIRATGSFDRALRSTHQLTIGQFEERWHRDLRARYGWLALVSSATAFWLFAALVLAALWSRSRLRYEERRAALDVGWTVDASEGPTDA